MRKFIFNIVGFVLLVAGVLVVSLFFIPNNKIPENSLFASIDKHQRLSAIKSPKIILVGGSNLPFGIKSKMIEDSIGMPVVNMGLHAGLGMQFILSEVKRDINEGDVVVLSLEYHHLWSSSMFHGEDVLAALLFDVNRECLKYVSYGQWLAFLPQVCLYSTKKLIDIDPTVTDEFADMFTRESFNEYGDETAHYGMASTIHSGITPSATSGVCTRAISELKRFRDYINERGAKLIMAAPSYPQPQYELDKGIISLIEKAVEDIGVPYVIKPEDCVFPDSLMFNSFFHLTEHGAEMRTQRLIETLNSSTNTHK